MLKLILRILKNEDGLDPGVASLIGAGITGGSTILGGLFGKKKEKKVDPYAPLRGDYQSYLQSKLGTSTPYEYNPSFELKQPEVESAIEGTILGKLGDLPQVESDIKGIGEQYYGAQKERMQERHAEEQEATRNMYNRLGLYSSTPGLKAQSDLMRKQGQEFNVLEADIARQGIKDEMAALELANRIADQYISQGQILGGAQREYQKYPMEMSMKDIVRRTQEEQGYAGLASNLLGGNPPQYLYDPNIWSQLGTAGQDIGTLMMLYNLLGRKDNKED